MQLDIWLHAGGRCEYPGCTTPLWKDELTLAKMNKAYLAHIIADIPTGPRGHPTLSEQLKTDPTNIMLLCDTHHRLIDRQDVAGHPVELLRQYKRDHEQRIERQTAIHTDRRTHLVLFGTRIGQRRGHVNAAQACTAVLPERYPADERGIQLDLAENEDSEGDPDFWLLTTQFVERRLQRYMADGHGPGGLPLNHLSLFALAPIPVLIHFGMQFGDIYPADVFQRQRSTGDWQWQTLADDDFDYQLDRPDDDRVGPVAVNLSLSGRVHDSEIAKTLDQALPTYTLRVARPDRDFLRAKEQLELFRGHWQRLLTEIRGVHGEDCEIHLFPAVPCSVAVEIGRAILPKSDPSLIVYDHDRKGGGFHRTIVI
ncbi:MAG TPA: SAVED domain-containing protein [Thermomicrobiales bacterium]|nr:SAVED domain-containing protein [Thermomicrobiales bacterium]